MRYSFYRLLAMQCEVRVLFAPKFRIPTCKIRRNYLSIRIPKNGPEIPHTFCINYIYDAWQNVVLNYYT